MHKTSNRHASSENREKEPREEAEELADKIVDTMKDNLAAAYEKDTEELDRLDDDKRARIKAALDED